MTQNVSETLNRAADLIEERGWDRGAGWDWAGDGSEPLCLEGAIGASMGILAKGDYRPFNDCPAGQAVRNYLEMTPEVAARDEWREWPNVANSPLWRWNDSVAGSGRRVIEVLRATAVIEAARETEAAELVTA